MTLENAIQDSVLLDQIEDVIANLYAIEDEPFTTDELRTIVDGIVEILDRRDNELEQASSNSNDSTFSGVCY